jgi:hypothetical protein
MDRFEDENFNDDERGGLLFGFKMILLMRSDIIYTSDYGEDEG